jgi:hypothetical protein
MKETNRIGCYISNLGVSNHGRSRQDHMTNDKRELCKPETTRKEIRRITHEMMMMENRPGNKTRGGEP